jgi:cardiolipin synthase
MLREVTANPTSSRAPVRRDPCSETSHQHASRTLPAVGSVERGADRIATIPNAISIARLACIPLFLWLLLARDRPVAAAILLAVLGATDWVDGWIARHFGQASEVGKVLDPTADRVLLVAAALALLAEGSVPLWVGWVVLGREMLVSGAVLVLAVAGARRIDVQWAGKAGTLALMFALPGFLLADSLGEGLGRSLLLAVTWICTTGGLALGWWAAVTYVPIARLALREGRERRHREVLR